jgi:flagellar basal-body rod protein FlgC
MGFLTSLDIAGSGLTAQKKRLDVIAENITNRDTLRTENGGPYRRKLTIFQEIPGSADDARNFRTMLNGYRVGGGDGDTKGGVLVREVIEDESDFIPVYDPAHPDADEDGYIWRPNVDTSMEMVDAMAATRSFSANLAAYEAMKNMIQQALGMGAR